MTQQGRSLATGLTFVATLGGLLFGYDTGVIEYPGAAIEPHVIDTFGGVVPFPRHDDPYAVAVQEAMVASIEKAIGPNQLWVAAYCNDVFGYLPSARVAGEGGYETRGLYSGGAGFFDPRAEGVVVEAVRKLAKSVGR